MVNMEWKDFETEMLQDPEIRKEYDALKPKYDKIQRQIIREGLAKLDHEQWIQGSCKHGG